MSLARRGAKGYLLRVIRSIRTRNRWVTMRLTRRSAKRIAMRVTISMSRIAIRWVIVRLARRDTKG